MDATIPARVEKVAWETPEAIPRMLPVRTGSRHHVEDLEHAHHGAEQPEHRADGDQRADDPEAAGDVVAQLADQHPLDLLSIRRVSRSPTSLHSRCTRSMSTCTSLSR